MFFECQANGLALTHYGSSWVRRLTGPTVSTAVVLHFLSSASLSRLSIDHVLLQPDSPGPSSIIENESQGSSALQKFFYKTVTVCRETLLSYIRFFGIL